MGFKWDWIEVNVINTFIESHWYPKKVCVPDGFWLTDKVVQDEAPVYNS